MLHVSAKAFAVDRAVEDARCRELVMAECAEECEGTPVTVRGEAAQAHPFGAPAPQRGHAGLDPGLIDEDEPARIKSGLPGSPTPALTRGVGANLFEREQWFFQTAALPGAGACGDRRFCQAQPSRSPAAAATTSQPTRPQHQTVPPQTGSSRPPKPTSPHAREDPGKEVGSCDAGLQSSQHLESQSAKTGIPSNPIKQ